MDDGDKDKQAQDNYSKHRQREAQANESMYFLTRFVAQKLTEALFAFRHEDPRPYSQVSAFSHHISYSQFYLLSFSGAFRSR